MFDNIGGKIKALAQVVCWIGIVCSVIYGIVLMTTDEDLVMAGFIVLVMGSVLAWVSSFALYGFGQLIENTDKIVLNTQQAYPYKKAQQTQDFNEDICDEDSFCETTQNEILTAEKTKDFATEIRETETADLALILQDQRDLYSQEEIEVIEKELSSRMNPI